MKMFLPQRFFATASVALLSALTAAAAVQAQAPRPHAAAIAAGKTSVAVKRCKDNASYAGRELRFQTRMTRLASEVDQRLEVKVVLYRRLKESNSYARVAIPGLSTATSPKDRAATVYLRRITIRNVETAARYKLRATFTWRNAETGKKLRAKSVTSKVCNLKRGLPKLSISEMDASFDYNAASARYLVTVVNKGASEAIDVPVSATIDGSATPQFKYVSLDPGESSTLVFPGPICKLNVVAVIDPLKTLPRLSDRMRVGSSWTCPAARATG